MCTIYFSKIDFRNDMRSPTNSARASAICRRLLGVPACWDGRDVAYPDVFRSRYPRSNSLCHWYGAHYYAACIATTTRPAMDAYRFWRKAFARELSGGEGERPERLHGRWRSLWRLACRRVKTIHSQAMALDTSVRW